MQRWIRENEVACEKTPKQQKDKVVSAEVTECKHE